MFRSVCNPIYLGLGTAAIFAMGASTPIWADTASPFPSVTPAPTTSVSASPGASPTPTPSSQAPQEPDDPSPSTTPDLAELDVKITVPKGEIFEGDEVTVTVRVSAERAVTGTLLSLSAEGRPDPTLSRCVKDACRLGRVDWRGKDLEVTLTLPKEVDSPQVRLAAEVTAKDAEDAAQEKTIKVQRRLDNEPTPTPTPSPSKSSGSGGSDGGTVYTPPTPSGDFASPPTNSAPRVDLPQVSPPSPELAPGSSPPFAPQTALRGNNRPLAQEMTFEHLATTQAAWLSALLVAFSLLLTQLRLSRRRAALNAAGPRRRKGAHRRSGRGRARP